MKLSIIILNYRSKGLLKQCLKGIVLAQPELDYEIIVVDNNSHDGSLAMAKELMTPEYFLRFEVMSGKKISLPEFVAIQSPVNDGFSAGNNLGIKAARGKYILILNPDIAIVPGVLEKMVEYMEDKPSIGIIGPRLVNPDRSIQYSCRRFPNYFVPILRRTWLGRFKATKKIVDDYLMVDFDHKQTIEVDWLFGACLLIRKSALDRVGLFDQNYFMYFEDLDLCRRFWENGYKIVYFAGAEIIHYHAQYSAKREGIRGLFSSFGRIHLISGIKYFIKYFRIKFEKKPWTG